MEDIPGSDDGEVIRGRGITATTKQEIVRAPERMTCKDREEGMDVASSIRKEVVRQREESSVALGFPSWLSSRKSIFLRV